VTKIDKLIESNFRKEIKKKYPTHGIYGEEFKNSKIDNEFIWVIDPIDGTKNFIHGNHAFRNINNPSSLWCTYILALSIVH